MATYKILTLNPIAHIDWIGTVLFPLIAMTTGAPLFGWAKPVPVRMAALRSPRRDFAMVAMAGPLSNLLLALVAALCMAPLSAHADMASPWHETALAILVQVVELNVLLAVFNMIPVPPLDGANVLAGFVPEGAARLIDRMRPYGFLVLYALLFTGVLGAIAWPIEDTIVRWLL